jgi:type II secretory ATPase GspE/PulE/Tfp pilus assembly ATPase PilB-like protein
MLATEHTNGQQSPRHRERPSPAGPLLGELLVKERLLTPSTLQAALTAQGQLQRYAPLGALLVELGLIRPTQLQRALRRHRKLAPLGEILVRSGVITRAQLAHALAQQAGTNARLGTVLKRLSLVTSDCLQRALATHLGIPFEDVDCAALDSSLGLMLSKGYARRHRVIPVRATAANVVVAMEDPTDTRVISDLEGALGRSVEAVATSPDRISRGLARLYGEATSVQAGLDHRLELIAAETSPTGDRPSYAIETREADELVRELLALAVSRQASDIHLETLDQRLQVRVRVDGELQALELRALQDALDARRREVVARVKVLGNLDIAERRRPQDGSFRARFFTSGKTITVNVRVSAIPGYYGESVVLRLLDPRRAPTTLDGLGFSSDITSGLRRLLARRSGMILLTGPTGSGKTTTLYAALMTLYRPGIRILTVEDPIEYIFEQFSQCEVNERVGNTFAGYLRSFLRHDPQVLMVGEIRDTETAEIALRAAQTGHLILSTAHTVDAVSAVGRLLDLNVDRNVLSSSLLGVLSQRLIRMVCRTCTTPYTPAADVMAEFFGNAPPDYRWARGRGCSDCQLTGYSGRMAVGELWIPSDSNIRLISKGAGVEELRSSARRFTVSMAEDVREHLRSGKTTLEELMRVLPYTAIQQFATACAGRVEDDALLPRQVTGLGSGTNGVSLARAD